MKNTLLKVYIYSLVIIAIINLIVGAAYYLLPNKDVGLLLMTLSTLIELPLIFFSIAVLIYALVTRLEKIYLTLPIVYVTIYMGLVVFGAVVVLKGIDLLDLSHFPGLVAFIISVLFYLFQIFFGVYLLRRKCAGRTVAKKGRFEKKSSALGIVSIVLGATSFIPLLGIFIGLSAIVVGISDIAKNKSRLGWIGLILGMLGILFTIGLYGSLFYFGFAQRGGLYDEMRLELVREKQLPNTINAIEAYKARFGEYPNAIEELEMISDDPFVIVDLLQVVMGNDKNPNYYYEYRGNHYYLFSRGVDGLPFTDDDVFPVIKGNPLTIGFRRPGINVTSDVLPIPAAIESVCRHICSGNADAFYYETHYDKKNNSHYCNCLDKNRKLIKRSEFRNATGAGGITDAIGLNKTRTYTMNGIDYELRIAVISKDNSRLIFNVNGEDTDLLREGDSYKLADGTELGVNSIGTDTETGETLAFFYLVNGDFIGKDSGLEDAKKELQASSELKSKFGSQSGCGFFLDVDASKVTLLNSEFENEEYSYMIYDRWRDHYDEVKDEFPGDSYYSLEGIGIVAYYNDGPVISTVWSMSEKTKDDLETYKDEWIGGLRANRDRDFSDAPEMEVCKDLIASGEEAYFIKSNFYRKSQFLNYHQYDVLALKNNKAYTITINIGYAAGFKDAEKDLDFNLIARDILRSLRLK